MKPVIVDNMGQTKEAMGNEQTSKRGTQAATRKYNSFNSDDNNGNTTSQINATDCHIPRLVRPASMGMDRWIKWSLFHLLA